MGVGCRCDRVDFVNKYKKELRRYFKVERKNLPVRKTIFYAIKSLDFNDLMKAFALWSNNHITISDKEWISVDGKAIRGTIVNPGNKYQNFVSMVSLFTHKRKEVITSKDFTGKKEESELKTFQDILRARPKSSFCLKFS